MPAAPSLLIVPYRSKTGKLYSQIPTSGAGDFAVTRNTEARRFNSAGLLESVASGIPRLDYLTSGGTAGCPALLVEPAATNLVSRSEEFNDASILKMRASVSGNTTTAPDGNLTADTFSDASGTGTHFMRLPDVAAVSGTTYAISIFAKAGTSKRIELSFRANNESSIGFGETIFDLASGVIVSGTGSIIPLPNNWYRCTSVGTVNASGTSNVFCYLYDSANTKSYAGTSGTNNVFVWGAQVETGSVATSYIPTTAGTGSRSADVVSVSGAVSGAIGQTEGTIYMEVDVRNLGFAREFISVQDSSYAGNAFRIESDSANSWRLHIRAATVSVLDQVISSPKFTTGIYKIAFAYNNAASGVVFAVNGTVIYTNASALTMPSGVDRVILGSRLFGGSFDLLLNDRIRAAALYTTRLTNAELAALTAL